MGVRPIAYVKQTLTLVLYEIPSLDFGLASIIRLLSPYSGYRADTFLASHGHAVYLSNGSVAGGYQWLSTS